MARISGSWRFRYDYSKLQRLERNREQAMRWIPLLVGVGWITAAQPGVAQGRVAGRVTLLEKGGKSSPDLGAAVVYLEGGGADGAARPVTADIAINDKEFVPRVVVVPAGSAVRFLNHDPFDHNVFSASGPNPFDLGQYGRGESKTWTFTNPGLVRIFCNVHPRMVAFVQVMAGRHFTQASTDGSFEIADVPPGTWVVHAWHERSPQVARTVSVTAAGASGIELQLDARGFRWTPHKNKFGKDYPTNAGRERY
ncbi:MAG TPA: plastocyanin/azurin family copper-binding protein [Gemmatimonadales bacterium]|nr:plastocyanin/azurin family copper-binding protein [Gemmatimonadales bacterium]